MLLRGLKKGIMFMTMMMMTTTAPMMMMTTTTETTMMMMQVRPDTGTDMTYNLRTACNVEHSWLLNVSDY